MQTVLDSAPRVAKLTGRMRSEKLCAKEGGGEVVCYEIEVLIREDQLLRQCYYCLDFETNLLRYECCGDDLYWCHEVCVPSSDPYNLHLICRLHSAKGADG